MSFNSKKYVDDIRSLNELVSVINYYYCNKLKNKRMICPFQNDKNPSFYVKENISGGSFYKCFGCGESTFIRKTENLNFISALKKAYEILGKNFQLPTNTKSSKYDKQENKNNDRFYRSKNITNNKEATINYYNYKIKEARSKGLDYLAADYENMKFKEESTNYKHRHEQL